MSWHCVGPGGRSASRRAAAARAAESAADVAPAPPPPPPPPRPPREARSMESATFRAEFRGARRGVVEDARRAPDTSRSGRRERNLDDLDAEQRRIRVFGRIAIGTA